MALLDIDRLTVSVANARGVARLLDDVSIHVERGERFGIVGESGSGKSLTALSVLNLLSDRMVRGGRIAFDRRDLLAASEAEMCDLRGRRIAMIFQEPMTALNPVKTIGAQIGETLDLHLDLSQSERDGRIAHLLGRVGLPVSRYAPSLYPHQLSGGQRQRVMIAMALACKPDLLIADEPTTALDVTIQAQILDLLDEIVAEEGMALILITHDLGIVSQMTERVAVMYAGRVVETGATGDLFARMAHPYTQGLFAASPHAPVRLPVQPGQRRARLPSIRGIVPDPFDRPQGCVFADRCPRAAQDCRAAQPPLIALEGLAAGHRAACIHPLVGRVPEAAS